MSSNTIIQAFATSLKAYNSRHAIVSAATPLELSKRDGIKNDIYAIKIGNSDVAVYTGDNKVDEETQALDITCFVETTDTHTDRDLKYKVMLDMVDELRGWNDTLTYSSISSDLHYTKYAGIINTVDDRPGFYAQTIRIFYTANHQTQ